MLALVLLALVGGVVVRIARALDLVTADPGAAAVARGALLANPPPGAYARAAVLAAVLRAP